MTVEQKDRITALRNSGKSYAEIARELGLGKSTVSNFCLRNGVIIKSVSSNTEEGRTPEMEAAEMTNEQKSRIAQLKAEGKSYGEIARELGIPRTTVSNFCLRNNLLRAQFRGNTVHAGSVEKQSVPACKVTVTYAEKPNEAALADALKILMNVR